MNGSHPVPSSVLQKAVPSEPRFPTASFILSACLFQRERRESLLLLLPAHHHCPPGVLHGGISSFEERERREEGRQAGKKQEVEVYMRGGYKTRHGGMEGISREKKGRRWGKFLFCHVCVRKSTKFGVTSEVAHMEHERRASARDTGHASKGPAPAHATLHTMQENANVSCLFLSWQVRV